LCVEIKPETRTKWNIEKIGGRERNVFLCEQATRVPGWQLHWVHEPYDVHVHIRPNNRMTREHVLQLARVMGGFS